MEIDQIIDRILQDQTSSPSEDDYFLYYCRMIIQLMKSLKKCANDQSEKTNLIRTEVTDLLVFLTSILKESSSVQNYKAFETLSKRELTFIRLAYLF